MRVQKADGCGSYMEIRGAYTGLYVGGRPHCTCVQEVKYVEGPGQVDVCEPMLVCILGCVHKCMHATGEENKGLQYSACTHLWMCVGL